MLDSLLPTHATDWMRSTETTSAERWDIGPRALTDTLDPWRCPEALLPWLAQTRGLDLWYDDWPERTKRRAIAAAPRLQRLKGTLAGLRLYLSLVGAEITYTRLPSDRAVVGGMTPGQRADWLARLPQLRVYPWRDSQDTAAAIADHAFAGDEAAPLDVLGLDPAIGRPGERVWLWRAGDEVALSLFEASETTDSLGTRLQSFTAFGPLTGPEARHGAYGDGLALAGIGAEAALLTGEPTGPARIRITLDPGGALQPIAARARTAAAPFELVAQPRPDPGHPFAGLAWAGPDGLHLPADEAAAYLYRRSYLADPAVAVPAFADGTLVEGAMQMTPATGVVGVRVTRPDPGHHLVNTGLAADGWLGDDTTQRDLDRAVEATRRAQGGTDILILDSLTFSPLTAADAPRAGDGLRAGQMIERFLPQ